MTELLRERLETAIPAEGQTNVLNITNKSVGVVINRHYIGSSKSVKASQFEAGTADKSWVSASKLLFTSKELEDIWNLDAGVDAKLKLYCLPSPFKRSIYLLPNKLVTTVVSMFEEHIAQRQLLVDKFCETYDKAILIGLEKLGNLGNPSDYPTVDEAREAFSYSYQIVNFSVSVSLKDISAELFKQEQDKFAKQWVEASEQIRTLLRTSMSEMVNHMVERLTPAADGKKKSFRSNTAASIQAFLETFDARNLTDDAELQKVVEQARKLVGGLDPNQLKTDEALRDSFAKGFSEMKTSLDSMITITPVRRITFEDAQ